MTALPGNQLQPKMMELWPLGHNFFCYECCGSGNGLATRPDDPYAMLVSREREKLISAIIYFVRSTKHCHTLKLFKLLNFLDFEHYRQTGRTVTGLRYSAWPMGPVPDDLWHEIDRGGSGDLQAAVAIYEDDGGPYRVAASRTLDDADWQAPKKQFPKRVFKPKRQADESIFTKRELLIMNRLSEFFMELRAEDMKEFSHMKRLPWRRVYKNGEGEGQPIPPELSLESEPIMHEMPTIDENERRYRELLVSDI